MTFHSVGNVIIPTDELIFFRGVAQPPTSFLLEVPFQCCPNNETGNAPFLAENQETMGCGDPMLRTMVGSFTIYIYIYKQKGHQKGHHLTYPIC